MSFIGLSRLAVLGLFALLSAELSPAWPTLEPLAFDGLLLSVMATVAFAVAYFGCWCILRFDGLHQHLTHDHDVDGIQKIHSQSVPRVGGLAIFLGLLVSLSVLAIVAPWPHLGFFNLSLLLLAALPIFLTGLIEDISKRVSIRQRLLSAFISAELAALLLHAIVPGLGVLGLEHTLGWGTAMLLLTIVGIGGVTHSFNLIDGLNGLAAGFAMLMLGALLAVAYALGDGMLVLLTVVIMMATLGFLLWNWPRGLLFLGDGGAYLLGFLSVTLSILLVACHTEVSPWFPLVVAGYPVMETLFSIYRRTWLHRVRHDHPDDRHLHQLLYQLICRVRGTHQTSPISCNSLTAMPILGMVALIMALAVHWYDNTYALMAMFLGGVIFYKVLYRVLYFAVFRLQLKRSQSTLDAH